MPKYYFVCILIFVSLFARPVTSLADTSTKHNRHFIVLIHGIGGQPTDFGYFSEAFLSLATKVKSDQEFIVNKFAYDTGNDLKGVELFTLDLTAYLKDMFKKAGGLRDTDKVSFLMHSQGGLIGMNFLFESFSGDPAYFPEISSHMDSFVTMSTPFGGTKIALLVGKLKPDKGIRIPYLLDQFGKKELEDMSYGSDSVYKMRRDILDPKTADVYKRITSQVRILQIAGVIARFNIVPLITNELKFYESDLAVSVSGSKFDFIYNSSPNGDYKKTSMINPDNYQIIDAFHFSIFPGISVLNGIANTPKRCINKMPDDCDHPAYKLLAPFLLHMPFKKPVKRHLTSFGIDVHVKLESDIANPKDLKVEVSASNENTEELDLDRHGDFFGKVLRWSNARDFRYYSNGYYEDLMGKNNAKVVVRVTAPGFKTYETIAPVERGFPTFIDINLMRE